MKNIAVITGASSGMGREFVRQMDGYGFDEIWGIALGEEKLKIMQSETKTPVRIFPMDLTNDASFLSYTKALEEDRPNVTWLINCSGFGKFGRYDEIDITASTNMIDLNCKALVKMTEITLPYMTEGGRIIEIASVAAFQPTPYLNVYAASKAFVLSYSRALNIELKNRKISVTCMCPFWTKTNFFKRAKDTHAKNEVVTKYVAMYEPKDVVAKGIRSATKRKEISICGFIARSQVRLVNLFPKRFVMHIWMRQQKFHKKYKDR